MGVIREFADRVMVMYAGRIAEQGPVESIFDDPRHPDTRGRLGSTPTLLHDAPRLPVIPGQLPALSSPPPGCRFAPRCGLRVDACDADRPPLATVGPAQAAACIRALEVAA